MLHVTGKSRKVAENTAIAILDYTPDRTPDRTRDCTHDYTLDYTLDYTPDRTRDWTREWTRDWSHDWTRDRTPEQNLHSKFCKFEILYSYSKAREWVCGRHNKPPNFCSCLRMRVFLVGTRLFVSLCQIFFLKRGVFFENKNKIHYKTNVDNRIACDNYRPWTNFEH